MHIEAAYAGPDPVEETAWLDAVAEAYGFPHALVVFLDVEREAREEALERHLEASARVRGVRPRAHPADWRTAAFRESMTRARPSTASRTSSTPRRARCLAAVTAAVAFPDTQVILGHAGFPLQRDPRLLRRSGGRR